MRADGSAASVIVVDCSELSSDEKLALADRITDELGGAGLALVKLDSIVIDQLSDQAISTLRVMDSVRRFIAARKDAQGYSAEVDGDEIVVHSADPIAAAKRKRDRELPPNVKQCPFCPFVTPYDEAYQVHLRAHLYGA